MSNSNKPIKIIVVVHFNWTLVERTKNVISQRKNHSIDLLNQFWLGKLPIKGESLAEREKYWVVSSGETWGDKLTPGHLAAVHGNCLTEERDQSIHTGSIWSVEFRSISKGGNRCDRKNNYLVDQKHLTRDFSKPDSSFKHSEGIYVGTNEVKVWVKRTIIRNVYFFSFFFELHIWQDAARGRRPAHKTFDRNSKTRPS